MTVAELEELLAMLPGDMPVVLRMSQLGARHITRVDKQDSRRVRREIARAVDYALKATTAEVDGRHPPAVVLEAGFDAPLWCHAFGSDVDFRVTGRWPAKPARRR